MFIFVLKNLIPVVAVRDRKAFEIMLMMKNILERRFYLILKIRIHTQKKENFDLILDDR